MQCNYLSSINALGHKEPDRCLAGPGMYEATEEDKSRCCIGDNFSDCPRYKASIKIKEAEGRPITFTNK